MASLGSMFDFEAFNLKDMLKAVKKDPERLLLGAADPVGGSLWGGITGKKYDPIVNVYGGPAGGGWAGTDKSGGVYKRAQDAGIDTSASGGSHDIAELVASFYGGKGAMNGLGNAFSGSGAGAGGLGAPTGYQPNPGDMQALEAAQASASMSGGAVNPGMGFGSPAAGMDWQSMMKQGLGGGQPQQQQQQQAPAPPPQRPGLGRQPGFMEKLQSGLFPVDSRAAQAIGPEALAQQRNQALMRMGLGMMSASGQGAGLGESALFGLNTAQNNLDGALQRGYENAREARAEQRQTERDAASDSRFQTEMDYRIAQLALEQRKVEQAALAQWRKDQIAQKGDDEPDVRVTDRGMFERQKDGSWKLVAGTEPTGVSGRPIPQGMANDLKANASVIGQIDKALPQLRTKEGTFDPKAAEAFGARNAMIDALTPDAISDNVKNFVDSEGTDIRATITNLNSYIVKERNGAAVTVAEFARQRGFLPTDKDRIEVVEKKLLNLRSALDAEQQYMLDFAESQGYRAPPGYVKPQAGASGSWAIEEVQ